MTATTIDFNDDGWPDLLVICDSTPSVLYRNNKNGTFTDVAVERGVAYSEDGQEQSGMGVAIGDYNGDGALDIVKTVFADDMPALYQNDGTGVLFRCFDHRRPAACSERADGGSAWWISTTIPGQTCFT